MNKDLLIIAIDPGDAHVGIYIWWRVVGIPIYDYAQYERTKNLSNDLAYLEGLITKTSLLVEEGTEKVLIIEKYLNYASSAGIKSFKNNPTSELIGVLQLAGTKENFKIVMQSASQAKNWTNKRLNRLGLINFCGTKHCVEGKYIPHHTLDAYRHFIYYFNKSHCEGKITKEKVYGR